MTDALMRKVVNTVGHLEVVLQKQRMDSEAARGEAKAAVDRARAAAATEIAKADAEIARIRHNAEVDVTLFLSSEAKLVDDLQCVLYIRRHGSMPRSRPLPIEYDYKAQGRPRPMPMNAQEAAHEFVAMRIEVQSTLKQLTDSHQAWARKGALARLGSKPAPVPQQLIDDLTTLWAWAPYIADRLVVAATAAMKVDHNRVIAEQDRVVKAQRQVVAETLERLDHEVKATVPVTARALTELTRTLELTARGWDASEWGEGAVTDTVRHGIRFGVFENNATPSVRLPEAPAILAFPFDSSLVIDRVWSRKSASDQDFLAGIGAPHATVADRSIAVDIARGICARLLAAVPPGKLQFTFVDPVALGQSVADFQHLADYNQDAVGTAPATTTADIEARLQKLTLHVEIVISKYLRGQFQTIEEYNNAAGEVAEPYRILVVFDFPARFSEGAVHQLLSLMTNGPRCGLFTIVVPEPQIVWPHGLSSERFEQGFQTLTLRGTPTRVTYAGPLGEVPYLIIADSGPAITFSASGSPESPLARLLTAFGEKVRDSANAVVTLDRLLPVFARSIEANRFPNLPSIRAGAPAISADPDTWWNATTARNSVAPIGRSGAQDVTSLVFSSTEIAGGAIMVGLPRSGKSTSLHAAILTMCMLYPPDELELYLLDAKHGIEFKVYEGLPHARMVSINSEREFSVAVLKSLVTEVARRAELMKSRAAGKTNITEYRQATGDKMPRIVVVMDEFHETFEEDDRLGHEAFAAFSDLVRQGPSGGVHIVVASQTLSSMPAMDRNTLKLLPERVAFMCNDSDADIVMGEDNRGTRTLSNAGEGLFNPQRGAVAHNKTFQGLLIDSDERIALLRAIQTKAVDEGFRNMPRVFDGDTPAERPSAADANASATRMRVPIGEPFSLSPHEAVALRRTREANVLLLGDLDDAEKPDLAVRAALHSFVVSARAAGATVSLVDFIGDEDGVNPGSTVRAVAASVGGRYVRARGASEVIKTVAAEVDRRVAAEDYDSPAELLVLFGIQRATSLSPTVTDTWGDAPAAETDATLLERILRDGPEFGVHAVLSADTAGSVQRRLGPDILTEFSQRIAGSNTTASDLVLITEAYSDVPPVRRSQLIYHDKLRGRTVRVRGYSPIVTAEE
jgi:DNA segregation ATPase FtsK/SpoIIIE, S-DNA-T family